MNKVKVRIAGILLLIIFISGVANYQFLRGPVIFGDDYLTLMASQKTEVVLSVLLSFLSSVLSIVVALILFDYFKKGSSILALTYVIFTTLNFFGIAVENIATLSVLEISTAYVSNIELQESSVFNSLGAVFYGIHKWAHYSFLLLSCLPVFILFYSLFKFKYVPKLISIFGMVAAVLMFIEMGLLMTGIKIPIDLLLPIGLIQLFLPFWLMIKGFDFQKHEIESK